MMGLQSPFYFGSNLMETKEGYHAYTLRKILFILACAVGVVIATGLSLSIGSEGSSMFANFIDAFTHIYNHLIGYEYEKFSDPWLDDIVIWEHRLPRTTYAVIAGAALGVSGAVMQSVMHNPLADPYTTGISSGAMFGVSVSMILGINLISIAFIKDVGVMMNAFIFSLIPMIMMVMLSPKTRSNPTSLILVGVAVTYLFNSINMFLMVTTDEDTMSNVYIWLVGSLSHSSWGIIPMALTVTVVGTAVVMMLSSKLNILALEDSNAKTLGINADNVRTACLVVISIMVATITCYAGIIGFIGLVCPHIVRTIIDADNKYLIPASAVFGGLFLLSADIAARLLTPNGMIPVGIVMSFVGAPIFLYLLIRRNSNVWRSEGHWVDQGGLPPPKEPVEEGHHHNGRLDSGPFTVLLVLDAVSDFLHEDDRDTCGRLAGLSAHGLLRTDRVQGDIGELCPEDHGGIGGRRHPWNFRCRDAIRHP